MESNGIIPADEKAPLSSGEAKFETLLNERFSSEEKERFARELDRHDRERQTREGAPLAGVGGGIAGPIPVQAVFDSARVARSLRFHGEIPGKVQGLLGDWLPELMAFAARQGMLLRGADLRIAFYTPQAHIANQGPLPSGLRLPASSFRHNPVYRSYDVRLILPERIESTESLLNVLRTLLARLYGDLFLREEIFSLEPYREDVERGQTAPTVGLAEQVALLSELPHTSPALEAALEAHARVIGINHKRHSDQTRKDFFKQIAADLDLQRLSGERQELVEEVFAEYVTGLRAQGESGMKALADDVEAANRQLTFIPPHEGPDYARLRKQNLPHYLRSIKLRLEFLLEALAGLVEDFETLDSPGNPLSPMAQERVSGTMAELESAHLSRPYLAPNVRLSEELERKRMAFPLEVHDLMRRYPPQEKPERLFKSLSKKLESSIHQRLYNALLILRHWISIHATAKAAAFSGSAQYNALKAAVANFRFRRPLLEALFARIGVVLDIMETAAPPSEGGSTAGMSTDGMNTGGESTAGEAKSRFPTDAFTRAWGQFAAHALLAGFLANRGVPKNFSAPDYWKRVLAGLEKQVDSGDPVAGLVFLLRRIEEGIEEGIEQGVSEDSSSDEGGLTALCEMVRQSAPAFRFPVIRALTPPAPDASAGARIEPGARMEQLEAWAKAAVEARKRSLRNAIVVGEETPAP
jgi:hypothetical protein